VNASFIRWTVLIFLLAVISLPGPAGVVLYANGRDNRQTFNGSTSCPSPAAEFSERKKETMTTTPHVAALPRIDTLIPSKIETATFGLG
jgi:hypothetical protein